jgi:hypothetical protein
MQFMAAWWPTVLGFRVRLVPSLMAISAILKNTENWVILWVTTSLWENQAINQTDRCKGVCAWCGHASILRGRARQWGMPEVPSLSLIVFCLRIQVNVPVTFHDYRVESTISPGDWIVGDLNGVICVPKSIAPQVVELLPQLGEAESKVEADIDQGMSFAVASKKHRRK